MCSDRIMGGVFKFLVLNLSLTRRLSRPDSTRNMAMVLGRRIMELNTASVPVDLSKGSPLMSEGGTFDPNLLVILAALMCALVFALCINFIVRWALRCSQMIAIGYSSSRNVAEEVNPHSNGLDKSAMRALPTVVYVATQSQDAQKDCPICLADFVDGENVRVLPKCSHYFHRKCIDKWLLSHSTCPTCRQYCTVLDVMAEKKTMAALLCNYRQSIAAQNACLHRDITTDHQTVEMAATSQSVESRAESLD